MPNKRKEFDLDQVTLTLDDNVERTYDVISIFPVNINNEEKMYIALLPVDASEDDDILLYRADVTDIDDIKIDNIVDDDECEAVMDAFDEMLDEQEFYEMFEDDDEE